MPASATIRQRRKEARPQELLDAALDLFAEKGFAATRSEEVAARAGVAKGTLYLYYPSKEELLKAVVQHNLSRLIAEGAEMVDAFEGPTTELLPILMRVWWERVGNTRASAIFKIMMSEARNFPDIAQFYADEVIQPAKLLLSRTLARGIERGEFRDVPLKETTSLLLSPMIFMSLHKHSLGACIEPSDELDIAQVIGVHIDLVMHGLRVVPPLVPSPASSTPDIRPARKVGRPPTTK